MAIGAEGSIPLNLVPIKRPIAFEAKKEERICAINSTVLKLKQDLEVSQNKIALDKKVNAEIKLHGETYWEKWYESLQD